MIVLIGREVGACSDGNIARREDAEYLALAQNNNLHPGKSPAEREDRGMYSSLSLHHLYTLLDCLIQAHRFARNFNANSEQRTLLWKSGFIGNAKPNLLKQETQSLSCCLRVMFRLYFDQSRSDCWSEIETRLLPLCSEVISYFLSLTSEAHGEAWTAVLLLLFTQLGRLEEDRLKRFAGLTCHSSHPAYCFITTFQEPCIHCSVRYGAWMSDQRFVAEIIFYS